MNLSSAYPTERIPPGEPAAHPAAPGLRQRRSQPPTVRRWRDVEIGSSLYSTGPLAVFLLAALFVVGAVWLLTLVPTFWMLALAAAMHAIASVLVLALTVKLLTEP